MAWEFLGLKPNDPMIPRLENLWLGIFSGIG